jgi:hypothetical protein
MRGSSKRFRATGTRYAAAGAVALTFLITQPTFPAVRPPSAYPDAVASGVEATR